MHETYRMLGREHEADLEREAEKWHRADEVRRQRHAPGAASEIAHERNRVQRVLTWTAAFVGRAARAEA